MECKLCGTTDDYTYINRESGICQECEYRENVKHQRGLDEAYRIENTQK